MKKEFKIENDKLVVSITNSNDVTIPVENEQQKIGIFEQETKQIIDLDKAKLLKAFVEKEYEIGKKNMDEMHKQFETVKDLQDIDEKILKQCMQSINKGSKAFKDSMKPLSKRIVDLDKKKNLSMQIEHFSKQMEEMESDLKQLNELLK